MVDLPARACCRCKHPELEPWTGKSVSLTFGDASSGLRAALQDIPANAPADGFRCPNCGSLFMPPGVSPLWPSPN